MIFVNFKTYEQSTGQNALVLVKILESVAHEAQIKIIPVVQATDLKEVTSATTLEVWVQKVDGVEFGAHTGAIIPEAVLEDGAMGTFLNHSESRVATLVELTAANSRAKMAGLKTLIFGKDITELASVIALAPSFVAYEPPELVGSATMSVASAQPQIIEEASRIASEAGIPLIVGAGIHSMDDVKKSIELGAVGVAVSSDIVKATDPKRELMDLVEGFK